MPDPNRVLPLLNNIMLGDAMSDHNGIRCYPAMHTETNSKYILKIISVPSSKTKLDALLLTGALENEDAAKIYFEERAKEITTEINILQKLSKQEGFLPCVGYQIVPMEDTIGFEVCILNDYRLSLERYMTKESLTQLNALNLGLDLCSALTACRRSGYLFANLKPSNIYITASREFRISDLGLLPLNTLKYAALPEHYIGDYTPPEVTDPFAPLNTTIDVYAVGRILYSIFNNGVLPEEKDSAVPAPAYADPELSEIILKACDVQPENRWQDPAQMGQMLVSYMQKNGAFDIPIIPPEPEPEPEAAPEAEPIPEPEIPEFTDNSNFENISIDEMIQIIDTITDDAEETPNDVPEMTAQEDPESHNNPADEAPLPEPVTDTDSEVASEEDSQGAAEYEDLSEEVSSILIQADELSDVSVPEPVVIPEPDETVLSEDLSDKNESAEDPISTPHSEEEDMKADDYYSEAYYLEDTEPKKTSHKIRNTLIIILLLLLLGGGFLFYTLYVAKSVEQLQVTGRSDSLTVDVVSDADESLLTVSCLNTETQVVITVPVSGGKASFTGLDASSKYAITVNISGLHVLTGNTQTEYATPAETTIVQYDVEIGETPGTVKITFAVNGPDSEHWKFTYYADGQEPVTEGVTGHSLTLKGLIENQKYTGILEPEKNLLIKNPLEISFTASELIRAKDLKITSCYNGSLTAQWNAPESVAVESWFARCYNDSYDKTINVKSTTAVFDGLNSAEGFTVEVWAQGQTAKQSAVVGENSITIQTFSAELTDTGTISLAWDTDTVPDGGWMVSYWINDSEKVFEYSTTKNEAVIAPVAPGCKYTFTVEAQNGDITTFCQEQSCVVPAAEETFLLTVNDAEITANDIQVWMCKRPASGSWTFSDIADSDYTQEFTAEDKAGLIIFLKSKFKNSDDLMDITLVVTDEAHSLESISAYSLSWNDMWNQNYYTVNLPSTPAEPGFYFATVYINNMVLFDTEFTVS